MDNEHNLAGLDFIPFDKARFRKSLYNSNSKSVLNSEVELFPYLGPVLALLAIDITSIKALSSSKVQLVFFFTGDFFV
jgi:hypothetical protein